MGSCQCVFNNNQDTLSNIPVAQPNTKDNPPSIKPKENKPFSVKDLPKIVTDFVQLPSKKVKDDNDISEFIKAAHISPYNMIMI